MKKLFTIMFGFTCVACSPQLKEQTATPKSNEAMAAVNSEDNASTSLSSVLMGDTEGCLKGPVEQFGRYVGDWTMQDWSLSKQDGKTWIEGKGARWNFTCVGNGIAVQDFWMPNGGGVGTNLRIYDPKSEQWQIAWTATGAPGFSHIRAREDENGNIIMHYVSPEQNPPRRITFYKPTSEGWNWLLEMQFPKKSGEEGETNWVGVYKMSATQS
jgi:hypothetical protein